jgi:lipopolysaccharide biosynthesis regulator YciM
MKKLFKFILYLICILALVFVVVFKRDWVQRNVINRIEGMYFVYKGDRAYHHYKLSYAIDYYKRGLELYDKHYTAWYNLGNIYVAYEDYYEAVQAYEQAIKHNNNYVVARMNLGIIQAEKLGNFDAAIEQYQAIINAKYKLWAIPFIYNNKRSAKTNRGLAYYNMGRAYRQKALYVSDDDKMLATPFLLKSADAYENAAKILKKNSDVRYNLALVYHLLGNYRDAGNNYCRAISLAPMNYEAHYNLAILLRRLKYFKASLDELEKAALLVSTSDSATNATYIFGILSEVSHSYVDFKADPRYVEMYETDNQDVDLDSGKKHKKHKKSKKKESESVEESLTYINDSGKIAPSSNIDSIMMKNMSKCAGYSYFKEGNYDY